MNKKFLAIPLAAMACLGGLMMTASDCKALDDEVDENGTQTPHTHAYVESTTAATCTHGGYVLHKCECGDEYKTDEVGAVPHSYVNYVCENCGAADPDAPVTDGFIYAAITDDGTETGNITSYSVIGIDMDAYGSVDVKIPAEHEGKPVTKIHKDAFNGKSMIKSVEIPGSVTEIANSAFYRCSALETLTLNEGLKTIGQNVFHSCRKLASVDFPSTLESIGQGSFAYTGLVSVEIPASVTELGYGNPFYACESLETLTVESGNTVYYSEGNCIINNYQELVVGCKNSEIPTENVFVISDRAFMGLFLNGLIVPGNIRSIGHEAFAYGGGVQLSEGLGHIGDYAFFNCHLGGVLIPASVFWIGERAFENAGLVEVHFGYFNPYDPDYNPYPEQKVQLERIGDYAFANNEIREFTIPASVTHIGNDIFHREYGQPLERVTVENKENWQFELYSEQTGYLSVNIRPELLEDPESVAMYFREDVNVWARQIVTSELPADARLISYRLIRQFS